VAGSTACRMEHGIDSEVLQRFVCFLAFIGQHGGAGQRWLNEFRRFISEGSDGQTCEECIEQYLEELDTDGTGRVS